MADLFLQSTAEEFAKDFIAAVLASHDSRIRSVRRESLSTISHGIQGSEIILPLASRVELHCLLRHGHGKVGAASDRFWARIIRLSCRVR